MNNRTRQWFKASEMLEKSDPLYMGVVDKTVVIFRRHQLTEMIEEYGDKLKIVVGDKSSHSHSEQTT